MQRGNSDSTVLQSKVGQRRTWLVVLASVRLGVESRLWHTW